jgi:hypothetical protein
MHMCGYHWRMVPKAVQDLIWKHYRPGQEIDKQPSVEYICVAFVSISCVALKEGKPLPSLNRAESTSAAEPRGSDDPTNPFREHR